MATIIFMHAGMSVIVQFAKKGNGGASSADSAIGTWTRPSTIVGESRFSEVI